MSDFYAVFDIVPPSDDWEIVAVLSKEQDALDYPVTTAKSIQKLPMDVILKILVRDRLNICSDAVERLLGLTASEIHPQAPITPTRDHPEDSTHEPSGCPSFKPTSMP